MANSLDAVIPQLLAQGLLALRNRVVMPRLVNRDYEDEAKEKGNTIDVPIPSAVSANAVVPGKTSQAGSDVTPTTVPIALDNWEEAGFTLTDKEVAEIMAGVLPMQASEAISALADSINLSVLNQYTGIYSAAGAAGTTPFASDASEATAARKLMNVTKAPLNPRFIVIDPDAEENAINLSSFQDASFRGDADGIINGQIGRKLGFDWYMDQQVPSHVTGTLSDGTSMACLVNGTPSVGDKTLSADETTLTGTVVVGDIFTIAGDTQQYVITAAATASGNAITLAFEPGLKAAPADDAQITFVDGHVVNLAFHRDAFALATRPLADEGLASGSIMSQVDPVSGLSLRLEVQREFKQTRWSFDVLWGTKLVRPELAARIMG